MVSVRGGKGFWVGDLRRIEAGEQADIFNLINRFRIFNVLGGNPKNYFITRWPIPLVVLLKNSEKRTH